MLTAQSVQYVTRSVQYVTQSVQYVTRSVQYVTRSVQYVTRSVQYVTQSVQYVTWYTTFGLTTVARSVFCAVWTDARKHSNKVMPFLSQI
jgi:uncharacterized protein YoxC